MSDSERDEIYILRNKGYSYSNIGKALNRTASAIWTEVSINITNGLYDPVKAKRKARLRRRNAKYQAKKIVEDRRLREFVDYHLLDGQSPAAISGRLKFKHQKGLQYTSKDSIYRYISSVYGRQIQAKLKKKKKAKAKRVKTGTLDGRTFITERTKVSNARLRIGHAEFDFIVSGKTGKGIVLVVVDRKLRTTFLEPIYSVSIKAVHEAAHSIKQRYPEWVSGTTDNDLLFARHIELESELGIKIYFCQPYHSWQKGSVENTNGVLRKYVPKSSDISTYSRQFFTETEDRLNNRFMECLDFQSPKEVLDKCRKQKRLRDIRRIKK